MSFRIIIFLILTVSFFTEGLPKNIQKKIDNEIMDTFEIESFQLNSKVIETHVANTLPSKFGDDNFFTINKTQTTSTSNNTTQENQ